MSTHKPGDGGLFAGSALCGATAADDAAGVLRMHEYDYTCSVCRDLAGETL